MADTKEKMTKEAAITILRTELKYTDIDVDYAHDTADGKVELVPGQDIAHALIMAIAALNEQPERAGRTAWIPVTERLPEESGEYLVCTARGNRMGMSYSAKYRQFNMFDDGIGTPIACTHWMPLPEPQKGVSG